MGEDWVNKEGFQFVRVPLPCAWTCNGEDDLARQSRALKYSMPSVRAAG